MIYVICSSKKWFIKYSSNKFRNKKFVFIKKKEKLNLKYLKKIKPKFIFFTHWSYKVPRNILNNYNCINFHVAPLPFGRGGSPIQNLIIRGFKKSPLCAIKMIEKLDAGPIILKKNLDLKGNLEEIFKRMTKIIEIMILEIIKKLPKYNMQKGEIYNFKRIKPKESNLVSEKKIISVFNKIRMLDSDEYPRAFIKLNGLKIIFNDVIKVNKNTLKAKCIIKKLSNI